MKLLDAWADWHEDSAPYILAGDREVMNSNRSAKAIVTHRSWPEAHRAPDFCSLEDTKIHLGLLPQPFVGNVRKASIYVLLLNPGLSPSDYYGEYDVPEYRAALISNLKQQNQVMPFFFLDPQFAWHGGFVWWQRKLGRVIHRLASAWGASLADARSRLGSEMCSIELFPYHSSGFHEVDGWLRKLRSVDLVRAFVADHLIPRVKRGEAIVIVTRKVARFGLPEELEGVTYYSPGQARGAHLTPETPGGRAILGHFGVSD